MRKKPARNKPCPCGSGKKYKKCCGSLEHAKSVTPSLDPTPQEQKTMRRLMQMQQELKPPRLVTRSQIQSDFKGQKFRAVGRALHIRPPEETFHEFLVNHLLWMLGKPWFDSEIKKLPQERHIVLQWRAELLEQVRNATRQKGPEPGPVGFVPSGNARALVVLADDVYQLEHALRTPREILDRLRNHEQFQGARYEVLASSLIARCGFQIGFIDDKSKKSPEFVGTNEKSGEQLAIEAKSRHRSGVLHVPAKEETQFEEMPKAAISRQMGEALKQGPEDCPFVVFVDLNLPLRPDAALTEKPWFKEVVEVASRFMVPENDHLTGIAITNFGWHYYREKRAPSGEFLLLKSQVTRYPLRDETWASLERALKEYGFIPDEEEYEKAVRARYPEFQRK